MGSKRHTHITKLCGVMDQINFTVANAGNGFSKAITSTNSTSFGRNTLGSKPIIRVFAGLPVLFLHNMKIRNTPLWLAVVQEGHIV